MVGDLAQLWAHVSVLSTFRVGQVRLWGLVA